MRDVHPKFQYRSRETVRYSAARMQIPQRAQMNPTQRQTTYSLDFSARRSHCRIANIAQIDGRNASAPVPTDNPAHPVG
jgi:hypothetical protein